MRATASLESALTSKLLAFLRTHDGDRRLNSYEVHVMVSGRGQPDDDMVAVERARLSDLSPRLTRGLIDRLRATRGPVFSESGDEEVLNMMGVLAEPSADSAVTLAGLLRAGMAPPRLTDRVRVFRVVIDGSTPTSTSTGRGTGPSTGGAAEPDPSSLSPRERQIAELLSEGSLSSGRLAAEIGITRQAVRSWLNRMAGRGLVRRTEPNRHSPFNRWELSPDP